MDLREQEVQREEEACSCRGSAKVVESSSKRILQICIAEESRRKAVVRREGWAHVSQFLFFLYIILEQRSTYRIYIRAAGISGLSLVCNARIIYGKGCLCSSDL